MSADVRWDLSFEGGLEGVARAILGTIAVWLPWTNLNLMDKV